MKNEDWKLANGVGKATGPVGAMPLPWVDRIAGTQVGFSRLTKDAIGLAAFRRVRWNDVISYFDR
jgi:hypothetical protein